MNEAYRAEMRYRLSRIEPGWMDGWGSQISVLAIAAADEFLSSLPEALLRSVNGTQAATFPRENGGAQIEWLLPDRHIEVGFEPDGQVDLWCFRDEDAEDAPESVTTENISPLEFLHRAHPLGELVEQA